MSMLRCVCDQVLSWRHPRCVVDHICTLLAALLLPFFFFSSRRRHTRYWRDWSSDVCSSDLVLERRMTTDAPHGDLPVTEEHWDGERIREYEALHVARGRTVLSAGAVRDGRLVGFTDLQVPLARPERANQAGTLVLREHRGHRLGARMKVAVLRELAVALPAVRRISTYNAEHNAPMVSVNEEL